MGLIKRGVHQPLEEAANQILADALRGVTKHSEKADILTPWKEQDRKRREVYVTNGTPDARIRRGMFHRAASTSHPHLNSRDGTATPARRNIGGSLATFMKESGREARD